MTTEEHTHCDCYDNCGQCCVCGEVPANCDCDCCADTAICKSYHTSIAYGLVLDEKLYDCVHCVLSETIQDMESNGIPVLPEMLIIQRFQPMSILNVLERAYTLEHVLEVLDEEFADPGDGVDPSTPAMFKAEEEFKKIIIAEYKPWKHIPVPGYINLNLSRHTGTHDCEYYSCKIQYSQFQ